MKYLDAIKAKRGLSVVSVGGSEHRYEENKDQENTTVCVCVDVLNNHIHETVYSLPEVPTETTETIPKPERTLFVVFVVPPWERPAELAEWPIERRQRWGELANQLEDQGIPWPEHERRAFREVTETIGASPIAGRAGGE